MTTSGRISDDFLRLLYILSTRQAHNYFTRMGLIDPSTKAFKQRRGTYFYYNRAAIGLACAQATAMRIDIAPHKRPLKNLPHHAPDPHLFHIPSHARCEIYEKLYNFFLCNFWEILPIFSHINI
jgi:hypothetical protein